MSCQHFGEEGAPKLTTGVFLVDKPAGISSFGVVRQARKLLGIKKIGHAGTLDPFATGLLVLCVGRAATRHIDSFMHGHKRYEATLQLGAETTTLDPEGEIVGTRPVPDLSLEDIRGCFAEFLGEQYQAPPPYSAAKYKGKPLYHYARQGIMIRKDPKKIEIFSLDLVDYDPLTHRLRFTVYCGKGTYIRVLAADIARKLGTDGYLLALRRTASGVFDLGRAVPGVFLAQDDGLQYLLQAIIPVDEVLEMTNSTESFSPSPPTVEPVNLG